MSALRPLVGIVLFLVFVASASSARDHVGPVLAPVFLVAGLPLLAVLLRAAACRNS